MKARRLLLTVVTPIIVLTLVLSACMSSQNTFNGQNYAYVCKNENNIPLFTNPEEVQLVTKSKDQTKIFHWANDWFINPVRQGVNQPVPYQVTNVASETLSSTVESSHTWAMSLTFKVTMDYSQSTSKSQTYEQSFSHQQTYGPVSVPPGHKCRLVAYKITHEEKGVFAGNLYKKQPILLGYKWKFVTKEEFGSWKKTTETFSYEFEIEPINTNE